MRAGLLNKVITFKVASTTTNSYGEKEITFTDYITTRARVVFKKEDRDVVNGEIFYPKTLEITIRSYHNINEDMIITYNSKDYRILSIDDTIQGHKTINVEKIND